MLLQLDKDTYYCCIQHVPKRTYAYKTKSRLMLYRCYIYDTHIHELRLYMSIHNVIYIYIYCHMI